MRLHKIIALFKLGLEDLLKNMNVLIYVILPLAFSFLYSNIEAPKEYIFTLCMLMMLAMVPVALMSTILAEEKEKNTLRTLMLNDVKASEILIAKAMITMLFVVIDSILLYILVGVSIKYFIPYQLVCLLVSLVLILLGSLIGLISKNQMSAGLISVPAMVFVMAPLFIAMIKNDIASKIAFFIPTDAMMKMLKTISNNQATLSNLITPSLIIFVWMLISVVIFIITYKKVGIDN